MLFLDTGGFHLYNNAFIVRRRIAYEDGFAIGDPEIVFKYRSDDMAKAQAIDVRPHIDGKYKIKFKLEVHAAQGADRRHAAAARRTMSSSA